MRGTKTLIIILLLSNFAFKNADSEMEKCIIKIGETINFSNKPFSEREKTSISMNKGAYDGSGYSLKIDTANYITISEISQSNGPKQDEFTLVGCTGNLIRNKESLTIQFEKCRKNYFLVNLDSSSLVGIFDTIFSIRLISEKLDGKPAEFYCPEKGRSGVHQRLVNLTSYDNPQNVSEDKYASPTIRSIHLKAVPFGIKNEDLYLAKHPLNSLANFTRIELKIPGGKTILVRQGSYILCEGNSFDLK